jgi:hypothetical protein
MNKIIIFTIMTVYSLIGFMLYFGLTIDVKDEKLQKSDFTSYRDICSRR